MRGVIENGGPLGNYNFMHLVVTIPDPWKLTSCCSWQNAGKPPKFYGTYIIKHFSSSFLWFCEKKNPARKIKMLLKMERRNGVKKTY
jgi:hypothetical protein